MLRLFKKKPIVPLSVSIPLSHLERDSKELLDAIAEVTERRIQYKKEGGPVLRLGLRSFAIYEFVNAHDTWDWDLDMWTDLTGVLLDEIARLRG